MSKPLQLLQVKFTSLGQKKEALSLLQRLGYVIGYTAGMEVLINKKQNVVTTSNTITNKSAKVKQVKYADLTLADLTNDTIIRSAAEPSEIVIEDKQKMVTIHVNGQKYLVYADQAEDMKQKLVREQGEKFFNKIRDRVRALINERTLWMARRQAQIDQLEMFLERVDNDPPIDNTQFNRMIAQIETIADKRFC